MDGNQTVKRKIATHKLVLKNETIQCLHGFLLRKGQRVSPENF